MARLPNPGGDAGDWGEVLNDFLRTEHNEDGTLKLDGMLAIKADSRRVDVSLEEDGNLRDAAVATVPTIGRIKGRVFDVSDYGAIGDDATDNRAAFQSALNAAATGTPAVVYVPPGKYRFSADITNINSAISIPSGVSLIGSGAGAASISWLDSVGTATHMVLIDGTTDIEIAHIGFDGNKSRLEAGVVGGDENEGINTKNNASRIWIHHCTLTNFGQDAIDTDGCDDITISDVRCTDNGGCAVHGTGEDASYRLLCANVVSMRNGHERLANAEPDAAGDAAGFTAVQCKDSAFVNCISIDDARGFSARSSERVRFASCTVTNPGGSGTAMPAFWLNDIKSSVVIISDCTIFGRFVSPAAGILIEKGGNLLIANNVIDQCDPCIHVNGGDSWAIRGNYLKPQSSYGVHVESTDADAIWSITDNTIHGKATGIRVIASDGVIANNVIRDVSGHGINIRTAASSGVTITGNSVRSVGAGVYLTLGPTDCVITGNDLTGTTGVFLTGSGHTIQSNPGFDSFLSGDRPNAAMMGENAQVFDTTLGKPIWSDGSVWVDATGTSV